MYTHLTDIDVDKFFNDYMPGIDDPPEDKYDQFHYESDKFFKDVKKEWELNGPVCQMVESVAAKAKADPSIFARDISAWQVKGKSGDEGFRCGTRPDCGIHFDNDRTRSVVVYDAKEFMQKSRMNAKDKAVRKDWIGRRSWADIVIPIEAKINHNASAFEFTDPGNRFTRHDTQGGLEALGQIAEYVTKIFGYQHRTHVYAIYLYRDQARILYFDRSGGVVTKPFHYGTREHTTLHRFFWKVARMSAEQLGLDPTATLASEEDKKKMYAYAKEAPTEYLRQKLRLALSSNPTATDPPKVPDSSQWPIYEVTVDGRKVLIGRPAFSTGSLFGRCTRGYIAFDVNEGVSGALRFLKDSWRVDSDRIVPEHMVYDRMGKENINTYVLTCLGGEDVHTTDGEWQRTRCQKSDSYPRGHYRILFKEVCRPLTDFKNFEELARLLGDAMFAHMEAWTKAGILHRDVSVNNILIYEEADGDRTGLLSDWDLCKYKEDMVEGMEARQPNRTGTWYFRSAVSLCYPCKPYQLSDDIESFVHVYHYCVLRFHWTVHTKTLSQFFSSNYEFENIRMNDGAHIGSDTKFDNMLLVADTIRPKENKTLGKLLGEMSSLCAAHYATIDEDAYGRLYGPRFQKRAASTAPQVIGGESASGTKRKRPKGLRYALGHNPAPPAAITPSPTLRDHMQLLRLFLLYGEGIEQDEDEQDEEVEQSKKVLKEEWLEDDLKAHREDFFLKANLIPRTDHAFSLSWESKQSEERASKRAKKSDGSALVSVAEATENVEDAEDAE